MRPLAVAAFCMGVAVGNLLGWLLRYWWETRHPRYIIVPDLREGEDNTAALQRAVDLGARLDGRTVLVDVRPGVYPTGTVTISGEDVTR